MDSAQIRTLVRDFFFNECGLTDDFGDSDLLFSTGLVNSLNVIQLVVYLESNFGIKITPLDMSFENFDSVDLLESFVTKKSQ
ncbi:MAG: acyl carrier protein [Bdellovibrionota bacterium]